MPKAPKAKKNEAMQISRVPTKKPVVTCSGHLVIATRSVAAKTKYVAGPANNVYTFG